MALLHDSGTRSSIEQRLGRLQPSTRAAWGKMTPAQMLWHVNQTLAAALGEIELDRSRPPIPKAMLKFIVMRLPWTKNAPTNPSLVAREDRDFDEELARCRRLLTDFAARPLDGPAQDHPAFGTMTVKDNSQLQAKHFDHHLKQFGV